MSSLARQLSVIRANNETIQDKKKRKKIHSVSLVYEPQVAANQDFDTIYSASLDALRELELLDPRFASFENSLFSETSLCIDRQVQTSEQNALLDKAAQNFLTLISPRLNLEPAVRALEWLVRRFQIHVYNATHFILAVLPYYTSPVFVRFMDIIPVLPPIFSFLSNSKKQVKNPGKNLIVRALSSDAQLTELVNQYVVDVISAQRDFHELLAFWSSTSIWTMMSLKESGAAHEEIVTRYLSHLSSAIVERKSPDGQIAAYMILAVIGSQFHIIDEILEAAVQSIALNWTKRTVQSGLSCIAQLVKNRESLKPLPKEVYGAVSKVKNVNQEIIAIGERYDIGQFVVVWFISTLEYSPDGIDHLTKLAVDLALSPGQLQKIFETAISVSIHKDFDANIKTLLAQFFETVLNNSKYEECFITALKISKVTFEMLELSLQSSLNIQRSLIVTEDVDMVDAVTEESTVCVASKEDIAQQISMLDNTKISSFLVFDTWEEFTELYNLYSNALNVKLDTNSVLSKLSNEALISFLCRVWTGAYSTVARLGALKTMASLIEKNSSLDLQGLIPSLLIGLTDSSEKVRRQSGTCILLMSKDTKKKTKVWGLDTLYGENLSKELKWMSSSEVSKFFHSGLVPALEECYLDNNHIFGHLAKMTEVKYLKTVSASLATFLSSHALAVELPHYKTVLINFVNNLEKSNSRALYPILEIWIRERKNVEARCKQVKASFSDMEKAVLNTISSGDMTNVKFLENCIKYTDDTSLNALGGSKIVEIFGRSKAEFQLTLAKLLIDVAIDDSIPYDSLENLNQLAINTGTFTSLLEELQLEKETASAQSTVAKRRRRSSTMTRQQFQPGSELAAYAEKHWRKLTVVLELFERAKPDANSKILSLLFAILKDLLSIESDSNLPVFYTEQVLSNCMIHVVENLRSQEAAVIDSNSIRVDIIVSCIRSSSVPQVQNRFLLLVAHLASLAPQVVLHSVMPIFTFMGANTIRQDDDFSAHVIEQTIAHVVPALLAAQQGEESEEIDYLLLSFIAAFVHIPRHRRVKLFGALVRTLSPQASLHKLLILLAKKHTDAKNKRKFPEAKSYSSFGESFLRSFPVLDQITALKNFLVLCSRIPIRDSDDIVPNQLLEVTGDTDISQLISMKTGLYDYIGAIVGNEDVVSGLMALKVKLILTSNEEDEEGKREILDECYEIIAHLMRTRVDQSGVSRDLDASILNVLTVVLKVLPITKFVQIAFELIRTSGDVHVVKQSAILLKSEFGRESTTDIGAQRAANAAIVTLTEYLKDQNPRSDILQLLLDALEMMVTRFSRYVEHDILLRLLDVLTGERGLKSADNSVLISAISCVSGLCTELGARMIGQFPKIVPAMFSKFETVAKGERESSIMIQLAIFGLLSGLYKRIPAFMITSVDKSLELLFVSDADLAIRGRMVSVIVETMEAKNVIESLSTTWKYAKNKLESIELFIKCLDLVVSQSSKKAVSSEAGLLVDIILQTFTYRQEKIVESSEINRVEGKVIETALQVVMKLNDKTFRPLFVRMIGWMSNGPSKTMLARYTIFFKFLVRLLSNLKSIVTNYYGYIIDSVCEFLDTRGDGKAEVRGERETVKRSILNSLVISFQYDRDEFWHSQARFDRISTCLLQQIPVITPRLGVLLVRSIVGLAESCGSPDNYKKINDGLLGYLKPDNQAHSKLWAIRVLRGLYERIGEEWIAMLPQLVPLIAELLEDDDESVEMEVRRKLIPAIEEQLGESLDRYLS